MSERQRGRPTFQWQQLTCFGAHGSQQADLRIQRSFWWIVLQNMRQCLLLSGGSALAKIGPQSAAGSHGQALVPRQGDISKGYKDQQGSWNKGQCTCSNREPKCKMGMTLDTMGVRLRAAVPISFLNTFFLPLLPLLSIVHLFMFQYYLLRPNIE